MQNEPNRLRYSRERALQHLPQRPEVCQENQDIYILIRLICSPACDWKGTNENSVKLMCVSHITRFVSQGLNFLPPYKTKAAQKHSNLLGNHMRLPNRPESKHFRRMNLFFPIAQILSESKKTAANSENRNNHNEKLKRQRITTNATISYLLQQDFYLFKTKNLLRK